MSDWIDKLEIEATAKKLAYFSKEDFNTMIEDEELGTIFAYINWPEEPCRQRRYNGQLVYYMKCVKIYRLYIHKRY